MLTITIPLMDDVFQEIQRDEAIIFSLFSPRHRSDGKFVFFLDKPGQSAL
jgi:hypothetical protein